MVSSALLKNCGFMLSSRRGGAHRRLHRRGLQPPAPALCARLPDAGCVRGRAPRAHPRRCFFGFSREAEIYGDARCPTHAMTSDGGEYRLSAPVASPCVFGRLFLGRLLPSSARFHFAGCTSVPPSTIPAQSRPVNLSSISCLTHGVQSTRLLFCLPNRRRPRISAENERSMADISCQNSEKQRKAPLVVRYPAGFCPHESP
jgi:hypothetical protein